MAYARYFGRPLAYPTIVARPGFSGAYVRPPIAKPPWESSSLKPLLNVASRRERRPPGDLHRSARKRHRWLKPAGIAGRLTFVVVDPGYAGHHLRVVRVTAKLRDLDRRARPLHVSVGAHTPSLGSAGVNYRGDVLRMHGRHRALGQRQLPEPRTPGRGRVQRVVHALDLRRDLCRPVVTEPLERADHEARV